MRTALFNEMHNTAFHTTLNNLKDSLCTYQDNWEQEAQEDASYGKLKSFALVKYFGKTNDVAGPVPSRCVCFSAPVVLCYRVKFGLEMMLAKCKYHRMNHNLRFFE